MGRLLSHEPETDVGSVSELLGIGHAIEAEAVRRYAQLAGEMDRLGEPLLAETFRDLLAAERMHLDSVRSHAERHRLPLPSADAFVWRLPAELATSWDDVAGSSMLTPYRALAIAVENEERAFAFYAYIAAHADDPAVAAEAEALAQDELAHAMQLRRLRRQAYHRERDGGTGTTEVPEMPASIEEFDGIVRAAQAAAAATHAGLASDLETMGKTAAAAVLRRLSADEARAAGVSAVTPASAAGNPAQLLHHAQLPLERLADLCERTAEATDSPEVLEAAQATFAQAISRLAEISATLDRVADRP